MVVAFGVAKIMQGAKLVRLAAEAFLLFVQKEPKYAWGCAPRPPNAKLRLDTNDVNIVRTAPQIHSQGACGAFYFGFCRDRIKNQPYKHRLAPDPGGHRPSGRGKWGPRKVARPCGERRTHRSGEGCPKQSIGSARLKRRLRPTSVGSLGRSPK